MEDGKRQFWVGSKAWFAFANPSEFAEDITFGLYSPDGGSYGELAMRWHYLGKKAPTARLEAFNDAWHVLATFGDLMEKLGSLNGRDITPDEFVEILKECGFTDRTPLKNPYARDESESVSSPSP